MKRGKSKPVFTRHLQCFVTVLAITLIGNQSRWAFCQTVVSNAELNQSVRSAIERSLPFISEQGEAWITQKKCITCHQIPMMLWALNVAEKKGFAIDSMLVESTASWTGKWANFSNPKNAAEQTEEVVLTRENDAISQLLLAMQAGKKERRDKPWVEHYRSYLKRSQNNDGSWSSGGQLPMQRRPPTETQAVSTMWAMLALQSGEEVLNENSETRLRSDRYLTSTVDGKSTEWFALRLLLNPNSPVHIQRLIECQNSDGGWGWLVNGPSDAFGTGLALYACALSGVDHHHPNVEKGKQFLIRTQQTNGSWSVPGTKTKAAGKATKTATYWGTCWASIALLELSDHERPEK